MIRAMNTASPTNQCCLPSWPRRFSFSPQAPPRSRRSRSPRPQHNRHKPRLPRKSPTANAPKSTGAEEPAARPGHRTVAPRVTADTLVAIEKSGVLRVGVALIIPWAMHDKNGELIGFEIDVAKKLARDLGVKPEFHPTPFRDLIPDLLAGKYDIIISGLSISAERALKVDFSNPYNETDVKLIASAKSPAAAETKLEAFDKDSIKIGVLEGSTAEDMTGVVLPNAQIIDYTESGEIFNDLVDGKLDAAVADSPRPDIVAQLFPGQSEMPVRHRALDVSRRLRRSARRLGIRQLPELLDRLAHQQPLARAPTRILVQVHRLANETVAPQLRPRSKHPCSNTDRLRRAQRAVTFSL